MSTEQEKSYKQDKRLRTFIYTDKTGKVHKFQLTLKEREFLKKLIKTEGDVRKAGEIVFGNAGKDGYKLLRRERVVKALTVLMEDVGLTEKKLVEKLKDGLEAMKYDYGQKKQVPDYFIRYKYLDLIFRLRGDYAPTKYKVEGEVTHKVNELESIIRNMSSAKELQDIKEAEIINQEENNNNDTSEPR